MSAGLRVGLDIGGTKVLGVVVAADGAVLAQTRASTVPGADGVVTSAATVLERLSAALDGALPAQVGVGFPGIVDRDRGAVSHAVNLRLGGDWLPIADLLAERTGAAVLVENDVRAATWGAHVLTGTDDLGYLSIGTGLAVDPAAIIIGGGITDVGEPLLAAVTAALRAQAASSSFLAALDLAARVRLVPAGVPVGAIGAAMIWDAR